VVIIDDLGRDKAKCLIDHLKNWADSWYNYVGEIKGGGVPLKYDKFIVTSNYSPEECFEGIDLRALKRRFKVIHMTGLPVVHTE